MTDRIGGTVTNVVDGDTFDMKVTFQSDNNKHQYNDEERIRIAGIDAPELPSEPGQTSKEELEQAIQNEYVRCEVQARDAYRRLVCKVTKPSSSRV